MGGFSLQREVRAVLAESAAAKASAAKASAEDEAGGNRSPQIQGSYEVAAL